MRTIELERTVLAYEDVGPDRGVPLLLVHGHPFDRSMWEPQLRRFGADRRVIVPDLRGHRAVVVGLSMGGQIALELWARHPDRVAGLLLADTTAAGETAESREARIAQAQRLLREGMDPYAVEVLYLMVAPDAPPAVAEHVLTMMRSTDPAGAAAAQRARADRPDRRADLAAVAVPTVVVVGDGAAHMPNLERPEAFDAALQRLLERVEAD